MIDDLLEQAGRLANSGALKPKQVDLRRAVSAAYYAVFHSFCRNCADTLVGTSKRIGQTKLGNRFTEVLTTGPQKQHVKLQERLNSLNPSKIVRTLS